MLHSVEISLFSIIHILREINFGNCRNQKSSSFTVFDAHNFNFWHISALKNDKNSSKSKFRVHKMIKMAVYELLQSPKRDLT